MPLRSQGYCAVGRGLSGLHWVRCNGRGPHLEWRQETHVSSPDFPWARSDSDRSFAAEFEQESQASSCVEEWNSACLSSCSRGDRSLLELCGTCGFLRTITGGVSAPSCCAFIKRVIFKEVSGHWDLIKSEPGDRGLSACVTIHEAMSRISS